MKIDKCENSFMGISVYLLFAIQFGIKPIMEIIESVFDVTLINENVFIFIILLYVLLKSIGNLKFKRKRSTFSILVFVLFISILAIEVFWGIRFYSANDIELFNHYISFLINQLLLVFLLFFMGYNFKHLLTGFSMRKKIFTAGLIIIYVIEIGLLLYGKAVYSNYNILFYGLEISYIYIADVFSIYSLLIISILDKDRVKIVFFTISSIFLIFIGSRSSLFIFFSVFIIFLIKYFMRRDKFISKLRLFIFLTLISAMIILLTDFSQIISNRMFRILIPSYLSVDYSMIERNQILTKAFINIKEHLFLGDFFAEYTSRGGWGAYIHNILSYWEEYGLFVFVLIMFLCLYVLKNMLKFFFFYKDDKFNDKFNYKSIEFSTYISIFGILSIILTRSYIYFYMWFVFGLFSYIVSQKKTCEKAG